MNKPYSESCDQNREPILEVIQPLLNSSKKVLEIGSGTGQHAVYFAEQLPNLIWQCSDCAQYLPGIRSWTMAAQCANIAEPVELDVTGHWPNLAVDAVFSANTTHIMHWHMVEALFAGVGQLLPSAGRFLLYGPFNYNGCYSSESNARFDAWLKARDPQSGIRGFEALEMLGRKAGLEFVENFTMPANNQLLYWRKQ